MTIAGLDPSGGAGILADIKTAAALGCYGVAVVTSITSQNTQRVFAVQHQTARTVREQILPLFDDFEIAAVKTGMLPTAEIIDEVADLIGSKSVPVVVVDPVLRSTSGFELADDRCIDALTSRLFPLATVVTPNLAEALRITRGRIGMAAINEAEITDPKAVAKAILGAAEEIRRMGPQAVLITGGEADANLSTDLLLDEQGSAMYSAERIQSRHTHGTGCTLSSALACLLAQGRSLRDSVRLTKRYVSEAILGAPGLGRGNGPLEHFPAGFNNEM